ncbi:MAG: tetratricopeptide repeat protein [Burkholderiales bacterium]
MKFRIRTAILAAAFASRAAFGAADAPLLEGLTGDAPRAYASSALAQRYFEQGMTLAWGFNAAEAARSFAAATRADPRCAACWWALAWAQGPTINADMDPAAAPSVAEALRRARATAANTAPRYRGLIDALAARHPHNGTVDEEAYAKKMRDLARRFPDDPLIATLAAEAELNLHPYDWWNADGSPKPWTPATLDLLARALALSPGQPGANHYRVHVMESSPHPERALDSAARLASVAPGSGHLLHMPAHIYMRTGRYAEATRANEASIAADRAYLAQVDAQRAYRVGYVAHNHHFLYASAAMQGASAKAIAAADAAYPAACAPGRTDLGTGILQHYAVLPLYARLRFGRWDAILRDTLPPEGPDPYPQAIWHFARGMAYAHTGKLAEARRELASLDAIALDPALAASKIKNINAAASLVRIAQLSLTGAIDLAEGRPDDAVRSLTQATAIEDALRYDEPHLWYAPTRHALGAALLRAGRHAEAGNAFREDLAHYPGNGWSLAGLAAALRASGRQEEASELMMQAKTAWRDADVPLVPAGSF